MDRPILLREQARTKTSLRGGNKIAKPFVELYVCTGGLSNEMLLWRVCISSFLESSEESVAAFILLAELELSYEILKGLCDVVSCVYMTSLRSLPAERRLTAFCVSFNEVTALAR